jgi:excisionase family DNA binding protein
MRPAAETLTVAQAAHVLGIPVRTAYAFCESGAIPSVRLSNRILVLKETVEELLSKGKFHQPTPVEVDPW